MPVEALYDWQVGQEITLRNLLQRHGYDSLDAVRAEGEVEVLRDSILDVFGARGLAVGDLDDPANRIVFTTWQEMMERYQNRPAAPGG